MRIGIHTSRAGLLQNSALKAAELGAATFQIFSSSPRMWRASVPDPGDVTAFRKIRETKDLFPLVIHSNYLMNLATLDPVIRGKSIVSFTGELERAETIGAEFLVIHPGNFNGQTLHEGIAALVLGVAEAARAAKTTRVKVLLENTVGAGCQIGSRFEELRMIRNLAARETDLPIGYCLDTCHLFAAGFNIAEPVGLGETLEAIERTLGLEHVEVIHTNDSKGALGSRRDRHANIGAGQIGEAGFRGILTHPALSTKPFILETPVDEEGDDLKNVEALKRLSAVQTKGKRKSK